MAGLYDVVRAELDVFRARRRLAEVLALGRVGGLTHLMGLEMMWKHDMRMGRMRFTRVPLTQRGLTNG